MSDECRGVVRREILLPVSPDELWNAITAPEAVREWFGAEVAWELTPGGESRFLEEDGSVREGQVSSVDPGRHLGFRWWPAGHEDEASEVDYDLEEEEAGTRLVITETRAQVGSRSWGTWDGRMFGLWCRSSALVRG